MTAPVAVAVSGYSGALIWGSIGVVVVLLLGFGLLWFRRKYHPDSMSDGGLTSGFSIRSIEEMRTGGMISDEEFRRLRAGSLGLDAPVVDSDNSTLSTSGDVGAGAEAPDPDTDPLEHKEIK